MSLSPQSLSPPPRHATALATFGWASFLAMSWTWCIGMFLPVILVRQFGFPGWLVFALPNVIGAAAMAWILRSRRRARALTRTLACQAFSLATIAFHFFFVSWVISRLAGFAGEIVFLLALAAFYFIGRAHPRRDVSSSLLPLLLSLAAMGAFLLRPPTPLPAAAPLNFSPIDLVALSCVCVFGFAFCPYLDLTFHRARQFAGTSAKRAFALGFAVLFFLMIIFSLFYARPVASWVLDANSVVPNDTLIAGILAVHMAVQSAFTVAVHQRELRRLGTGAVPQTARLVIVAGVALVLFDLPAALHAGNLLHPPPAFNFLYPGLFHSMPGGELIYRLFMAFYGLFFPAYVWLRIVPAGGGGVLKREPVTGKTYLLLTTLALPLFYLGFIEAKPFFLIPGIALLLLGRLLGPKSHPSPPQ